VNSPQSANNQRTPGDAYIPLRLPQFQLFTAGRNLSGFADAVQAVAVGWEVYARTHNNLSLAYVGLSQAAPILLFALPAGHLADRLPRKLVSVAAQAVFALFTLLLGLLSALHGATWMFYACLFCAMTARAFGNPARASIMPQIVPTHLLGSAIGWDTSIRRIAVLSGAAAGGFLLEATSRLHGLMPAWILPVNAGTAATHAVHHAAKTSVAYPCVVYLVAGCIGFLCAGLLACLRLDEQRAIRKEPVTWAALAAGIHYVRGTKIILATITLDLLAVLFGGATSLLPAFASDILHTGAGSLGLMRSAGSVGALVTALTMAHMRPVRYPGRIMLAAVAGFGLVTILFGFAHSLPAALAALALIGALDMISVVVRQTLIQTLTPNHMRGRVNAINAIFVNSSNEIGGAESGFVAHYTSTIFSIISGGVGSMLVVAYAVRKWPSLTQYDVHSPAAHEPEGAPGPSA
jgi:MFS family permease